MIFTTAILSSIFNVTVLWSVDSIIPWRFEIITSGFTGTVSEKNKRSPYFFLVVKYFFLKYYGFHVLSYQSKDLKWIGNRVLPNKTWPSDINFKVSKLRNLPGLMDTFVLSNRAMLLTTDAALN